MKTLWSWFWLACVGCSRVAGTGMPHERTEPTSSSSTPSATTIPRWPSVAVTAPTPTKKNLESIQPVEVVALDPDQRSVMLEGSLDRKDLMRRGVASMQRGGIASSFLELPGARHGEMGTDAERVMDEALRRVLE